MANPTQRAGLGGLPQVVAPAQDPMASSPQSLSHWSHLHLPPARACPSTWMPCTYHQVHSRTALGVILEPMTSAPPSDAAPLAAEGAAVAPFALHAASRAGDADELQKALNALITADAVAPRGEDAPPSLLLQELHRRDDIGHSPLHVALIGCKFQCARLLIEQLSSVSGVDGCSVAHIAIAAYACHYSDTTYVEELLGVLRLMVTRGLNTLASRDGLGRTPLHLASWFGVVPLISGIISIITDAGREVKLKSVDNNGWTVLHYAAAGGHCDAVTALMAAGVSPRLKNNSGNNAAHVAAGYGHEAVVAQLSAACDACAKSLNAFDETPADILGAAFPRGRLTVPQTAVYHHGSSVLHLTAREAPEKPERIAAVIGDGGSLRCAALLPGITIVSDVPQVEVRVCDVRPGCM